MPACRPNLPIPTSLISDNVILRSRISTILQGTPFAIAETVPVDDAKWLHLAEPQLGLIIIEANQNGRGFLEAVRLVKRQFPEARVVALAERFDLHFVASGHEAGVDSFCLAACSPSVLIAYLDLVMAGGAVVPAAVLRAAINDMPSWREPLRPADEIQMDTAALATCRLSAREAQILRCLTEGSSNKVIARRLAITEATIKVHVKTILRKIGVANRTQAAMWACLRLTDRGSSSHV